jgi:hypothetical protein
MRRLFCLAGLMLGGLMARSALAGSCDQPLASACIDSDTFWPSAGPTRFASLQGTQTTAPNQFSFGLVTTYLQRPIVLEIPTPGPTGTKQNAISDQVNGNFLFGYGVTRRLELHVSLPVTFAQGGSGTATLTGGDDLRDTALRDLRFGAALAIFPEDRVDPDYVPGREPGPLGPLAGSLTARFDMVAPTGDKSQFASGRTGVFAPSIAGGLTFGRLYGTVDAGLRLRGISQFAGARVGTQATFGLGVGYSFFAHDLLAVSLEARALPTFSDQADTVQTSTGLKSTPNGIHITPAEWMLGVRSAPTAGGDFVVTAGGGTGIPIGEEAITRPRLRFLLGLAYAPRGLDSDGDGVLDRDDACPSVPGLRVVKEAPEGSKNPPRRGCPQPREEEGPAVDFTKGGSR